ncbi:hypothetical protein GCM10010358_24730 [Streptomyces minutiscleroticus]|uniref:Uncharacterized protein n=1 Tax=Streptomyces minutiscleroticus TaxID=68238 RepID=A0A918KN73_9ACTN|nr:hypothetical protein GCM10010358_24730 [Streptomyces minutiscleroticus]
MRTDADRSAAASRDRDAARLSPLKHRDLNPLGRHSFTAGVPAAGALRPLRDRDAPEPDEDGDGNRQDRSGRPGRCRAVPVSGRPDPCGTPSWMRLSRRTRRR